MEEKQLFKLVGAGNTESQEKIEKTDSLFYARCLETSEKKIKLANHITLFLAILLVFSIGIKFLC